MINYLLAALAFLIVCVSLNILVMMYGWGLQPKSWWWIIGVGIFINLFLRIIGEQIKPPK